MRQQITCVAAVLIVGCGSERKPNNDQTQSAAGPIEVRPPAIQLPPKGAQQFTLGTSTLVTWSVTEATGGSITQAGLYTAPAYSGVFHVRATSTANAAVSGQAVVTVESGVSISATSPVSAFACEAVQLAATVSGSADTGVLWSAPDTCGTVTATGIFISLRGTGSCVVTAQAHADLARLANVTVNIAPERVLSVAVVPASVTLGPGGGQTFAANVTTACGTFPAGM
jgi:hypothetical protein